MTNAHSGCSCGEVADHVIAKRHTSDGIIVKLWVDGAVTVGLNTYAIRGGSTPASVRRALDAGWLVMSEVELYDQGELRQLCEASRRAVRQSCQQPIDYLRRVMSGAKFQATKQGQGRTVQHARSCECPRCMREMLACGGTKPFRGPSVYRHGVFA